MKRYDEIINGETYQVTEDSGGNIIKELKMMPEQLAFLEAEKMAVVALISGMEKEITESLPSWKEVSNEIDSAKDVGMLKIIIKKLARVVYWLAKNKAE